VLATEHATPAGMNPNYTARRLIVALVAASLVGITVWLVHLATTSPPNRSSGATTHHARPATGPTGTRVSHGPVPTTVPAGGLPVLRNLAVAMTELQLVDTSRQLVSDGVVLAPDRSLPTYVWTPVATGRYPLVVFVHGYDRSPLQYERFCSTLASSGYVVAAPSFPLEDPSRGNGLNRADLPNEAVDVSFVITSMEADAPTEKLAPSKIGVVGHSDGADVALEIGYEQGTADKRVLAVVADAPDPVTSPLVPSTAPLLLVQGTADSVVPYAASQAVFDQLPGPTYYVSLLGADHLPPIAGDSPWTPVLDASVAEFLDATLADRGPGTSALTGQLASSPLVRLATKG